ncbi:MAG: PfkB family carbohydrate kinase [Kiritimatiellia bacterium]|jgi:sugar/nucleoside kinase (ribokinase family)
MPTTTKINLTVVGSLALDTVATPSAKHTDVLGGSVSYACAAAALFTKPGMVGVAGSDFPEHHRQTLQKRGIDLTGLQQVAGKTFRWSGEYEADMNSRRTLATHLNVFENFNPRLPTAYRHCRVLFLANIHPELQLHVLSQVKRPALVAADTMDLWINTARPNLIRLLAKVDMLLINDDEARALTGTLGLAEAARKISAMGPRYVLIKKGEHGCLLFDGNSFTLLPAYPLARITDTTGAGDSFAGGMLGYLSARPRINADAVRDAMLHGTITASFAVESFSIDRMAGLTGHEFNRRLSDFKKMLAF